MMYTDTVKQSQSKMSNDDPLTLCSRYRWMESLGCAATVSLTCPLLCRGMTRPDC